jgi:spermidine/putrescine transport system substrate-binding protein
MLSLCCRSRSSGTLRRAIRLLALLTVLLGALASCGKAAPAATTQPAAAPTAEAKELVFYNWPGYMPQSVLNDFQREFGVSITYMTYDSAEEAVANLKARREYDVVVTEHQFLPSLIAEGLLARIDRRNLPNFKNISPNFRGLTFDIDNTYSVPFSWGTGGLIVRSDLVKQPVKRWADLWRPDLAGKIGVRETPEDLVGTALMSLGYHYSSSDPRELRLAEERLILLKPALVFVSSDLAEAAPKLLSGEIVVLHGWSSDALLARQQNPAVRYVLPEEGAIVWGESMVIPATSRHKETAEQFINFMLRPEISARVVNEYGYATANAAATPLIKPELRNDPIVYPPDEVIRRGYIIAPPTVEAEKLRAEIWQRFMGTKSATR